MIEGHDIICFSNDWNGDPLSKKHIMRRLARRNRVLWVNSIGNRNPTASARDLKRMAAKVFEFAEGCRQVDENLYVFSPIAIPFHGSPAARAINRRLLAGTIRLICRRLRFQDAITWTFAPPSADVVGELGEKYIIYHCVDEFSEFTGSDKAAILEMERQLIRKSDAVIVSSGPLYDVKCREGAPTFLVTHGVDVAHFRKACEPRTPIPQDIARLPRPVIGFFGLVADWVDLDLMRFLAQARPGWSFVFIGKHDTDVSRLEGLPNVYLLGRREYRDLPGYCRRFDVAVLPFVVNELTVAANPLKLREYLAAGLPVVATAIPETERLEGLLRVGRTREEFLAHVDDLIDSGETGPQLRISRTMDSESWDCKVEELSRIVARVTGRAPETEPVREWEDVVRPAA